MIAATYVINLSRSAARWRAMGPVLATMQAPAPTRFEGFDGSGLNATAIAALQEEGRLATDLSRFRPVCMPGEIGCALSHAGVLADIIERQLPAALILEDDIALSGRPSDWRERFARAFADLPADWELWYLYRCFDIAHRATRVSRRIVVPWSPQGGAAYAVTLRGARTLLRALTPVADAVDRVYADLVRTRRVAAYAASPQLVVPGAHPSIIHHADLSTEWVCDGVNRPPEYWPKKYFHHFGETAPKGLFYWRQDIVDFCEGAAGRLRRLVVRR